MVGKLNAQQAFPNTSICAARSLGPSIGMQPLRYAARRKIGQGKIPELAERLPP